MLITNINQQNLELLSILGIEQVHTIKGKTLCIQLTTLMIGFQGIIFNILAQFDVFPCVPPLNFTSRRKGN